MLSKRKEGERLLSKEQLAFYTECMTFIAEEHKDKDKRKLKGKFRKIRVWILSIAGLSTSEIALFLDVSHSGVIRDCESLHKHNYMDQSFIPIADIDNFTVDLCMLSLSLDGYIRTVR